MLSLNGNKTIKGTNSGFITKVKETHTEPFHHRSSLIMEYSVRKMSHIWNAKFCAILLIFGVSMQEIKKNPPTDILEYCNKY